MGLINQLSYRTGAPPCMVMFHSHSKTKGLNSPSKDVKTRHGPRRFGHRDAPRQLGRCRWHHYQSFLGKHVPYFDWPWSFCFTTS